MFQLGIEFVNVLNCKNLFLIVEIIALNNFVVVVVTLIVQQITQVSYQSISLAMQPH